MKPEPSSSEPSNPAQPDPARDHPIQARPDLYGSLIREISIIQQQFSTRANQELKPLNLNFSQLSVLSHLMHVRGPVSITELASQMDLNQPAVTKMVQHLLEQGWIDLQTASEDARRKQLQLNEQGRGVFMQAQLLLFPLLNLSFSGVELTEATALSSSLIRIRQNLS